MRIGVLSDTHIPLLAREVPEQVLEVFKDVDMILHAGDIVDSSVLYQLSDLAEVHAVRGNMDSTEIQDQLPFMKFIEVEQLKLGLVHGYGPAEGLASRILERMLEGGEEIDIMVFGHSHNPENRVIDNILCFNPGSPTDKRFAEYRSFGILNVEGRQVRGEVVPVISGR